MIPLKTVEELIIRHSSIEKDLSTGGLDNKLFAEKSEEYSDSVSYTHLRAHET